MQGKKTTRWVFWVNICLVVPAQVFVPFKVVHFQGFNGRCSINVSEVYIPRIWKTSHMCLSWGHKLQLWMIHWNITNRRCMVECTLFFHCHVTLQELIYPTLGKGKITFKSAFWVGYVSSLQGSFPGCDYWYLIAKPRCLVNLWQDRPPLIEKR